ncbi:MAG: hypothetical protein ACFFCW_21130, partial [Candidatus Hodarchaeota archaeon]
MVVTNARVSPITLSLADYCMWARENKRFVSNIKDVFSPDDCPVDDVGFRLNRKPNGNVSLKMFHTVSSPVCLKMYAYKRGDRAIQVGPGEVVMNDGGCYGDTALYFADKTGVQGKIYYFEFVQ